MRTHLAYVDDRPEYIHCKHPCPRSDFIERDCSTVACGRGWCCCCLHHGAVGTRSGWHGCHWTTKTGPGHPLGFVLIRGEKFWVMQTCTIMHPWVVTGPTLAQVPSPPPPPPPPPPSSISGENNSGYHQSCIHAPMHAASPVCAPLAERTETVTGQQSAVAMTPDRLKDTRADKDLQPAFTLLEKVRYRPFFRPFSLATWVIWCDSISYLKGFRNSGTPVQGSIFLSSRSRQQETVYFLQSIFQYAEGSLHR